MQGTGLAVLLAFALLFLGLFALALSNEISVCVSSPDFVACLLPPDPPQLMGN